MKNWKTQFPHREDLYSDQEDEADTKGSERNGVEIDAM